jgi:NAD(P)-dependent dehydrogenase (short-subunit alcohol dehydrogenase family)
MARRALQEAGAPRGDRRPGIHESPPAAARALRSTIFSAGAGRAESSEQRGELMDAKLKPAREQVIVVTGASSGIGRATAQEAARRGARVVLFSRDEVDLPRAAEEIRASGGEAAYVVGDVAEFEDVQRLAETAVREFGRIDTWVNNAGVSIYGRIEEVALDDARRLFETNYWGVVNGSLAALPHLRREGGVLINVGSVLSETGYPLQGHYAASKHAVKGFTDSLRLELEEEGAPVVVTLVQPAAIDTPYTEHARNYLVAEPKQVPPVYAPEVVADAILTCATSPHRNLRVGGGAKMFTMAEKVAPGLADRMKMPHFEGQLSDRPPRGRDALHGPVPGDATVHGHYPGHVLRSSAYTAVAKRPGMSVLGIAALGVGVAVAARALLAERGD